jgi:hypothetical protein
LLHAAVCIRGKQTGKKIGLKPILSLDEWDFLSEKLEIGKSYSRTESTKCIKVHILSERAQNKENDALKHLDTAKTWSKSSFKACQAVL